MNKRLRVAVIGASHWHSIYDAAYLKLLCAMDLNIVGVSDPNIQIANARAALASTTAYVDYREMIQTVAPDFVLAMGKHSEMPDIFRFLIDTGVPFLMEKPWGIDADTVESLRRLSEERKAWVAVPFMTRYTHWAEYAKQQVQSGGLGKISHITFRMIRPTIQRYVEWDSGWMLNREEAGGGALLNLGSHGFDICRYITGEEPEVVACVLSNRLFGYDVEEYAHVTLRTPSGIVFHNEVGYTMPTWPANSTDGERKVAGEKAIVRLAAGQIEVLNAEGTHRIAEPEGYVSGHRRVLQECIASLVAGDPPPVTAADCAAAVRLIHDAYAIGRKNTEKCVA